MKRFVIPIICIMMCFLCRIDISAAATDNSETAVTASQTTNFAEASMGDGMSYGDSVYSSSSDGTDSDLHKFTVFCLVLETTIMVVTVIAMLWHFFFPGEDLFTVEETDDNSGRKTDAPQAQVKQSSIVVLIRDKFRRLTKWKIITWPRNALKINILDSEELALYFVSETIFIQVAVAFVLIQDCITRSITIEELFTLALIDFIVWSVTYLATCLLLKGIELITVPTILSKDSLWTMTVLWAIVLGVGGWVALIPKYMYAINYVRVAFGIFLFICLFTRQFHFADNAKGFRFNHLRMLVFIVITQIFCLSVVISSLLILYPDFIIYSAGQQITYTTYGELWVNALYWVVMTFSSIGYGDLIPNGLWAKGFSILIGMYGYFMSVVLIATILQKFADHVQTDKDSAH